VNIRGDYYRGLLEGNIEYIPPIRTKETEQGEKK
jgi:hypothetical protein